MPTWLTAGLTAIGESARLAFAIFTARNSPAMQDNAKAATIAKIRASVNQHINANDLSAVQSDGSTQ